MIYQNISISNPASSNPYTFDTLVTGVTSGGPENTSARKIWITNIQAYMPFESSDTLDIPLGPIGPPGPAIDPLWAPKHIPWPQWTIKITCTALQMIRGVLWEDPSIVASYWETSAHSDQVGRYKKIWNSIYFYRPSIQQCRLSFLDLLTNWSQRVCSWVDVSTHLWRSKIHNSIIGLSSHE